MPFFLAFFVVNSIATNVFNYVKIGRREWVGTAWLALFNALGPLLVLAVAYTTFLTTGLMPGDSLSSGLASMNFWLYPMVLILPLAVVVSRMLYKATRNPYLPGAALGLLVTVMVCTNAMTVTV